MRILVIGRKKSDKGWGTNEQYVKNRCYLIPHNNKMFRWVQGMNIILKKLLTVSHSMVPNKLMVPLEPIEVVPRPLLFGRLSS